MQLSPLLDLQQFSNKSKTVNKATWATPLPNHMIIKSSRTILHLLYWHEIHLIWCFIWCAIFQFLFQLMLRNESGVDITYGFTFYFYTHTHTQTHAWSGSKANISITCNWAPLTDPANTASTTSNYMFWLLTPGHRLFLPRKSFLTLPIGDLFVFHFDFFCLELGPVIVPSLCASPWSSLKCRYGKCCYFSTSG